MNNDNQHAGSRTDQTRSWPDTLFFQKARKELERATAIANRAVAAADSAATQLQRIESSLWVRLGRWLRVSP